MHDHVASQKHGSAISHGAAKKFEGPSRRLASRRPPSSILHALSQTQHPVQKAPHAVHKQNTHADVGTGRCSDECAKEGILAVTLNVLLAIHKAVFAALDAPAAANNRDERDWDVRHVLGSLRKQVHCRDLKVTRISCSPMAC